MAEPLALIRPVFARHGMSLARLDEVLEDGFTTHRLTGPWRPDQVVLLISEAAGEDPFRLEVQIDIPVASEPEAEDGLPAIVDPDTVVRMLLINCRDAVEAFFEEAPADGELLDPDASGSYGRRVPLDGLTETVLIMLHVGCDVAREDLAEGLPQAAELLCAVLATLRADTPFLDGAPNRAERRRSGGRRRR